MYEITKEMKKANKYMINKYGNNLTRMVSVSKYSNCKNCIYFGVIHAMIFYCIKAEQVFLEDHLESCKFYIPAINYPQSLFISLIIKEFEMLRRRFGFSVLGVKKGLKLLW